ncbi:MAG: hypothetical protein OXT09_04000 [Myxococcales bacterium]|nr:hypothetical protein [Myxococcales bacterium]
MSGDLEQVRQEVRQLLQQSEAFQGLGPEDKRSFAHNMVKVGDFLSQDPGFLDASATPARARALAEGEEDPVEGVKRRLAEAPQQVGKDFRAGAVREGTEAFRQLVRAVDFPDFVSSLIQGVFRSIVDASIQQMEAYGELLAAVSRSVDDFAKEQITDGQARDHLRNRYPAMWRSDTRSATARLSRNPDDESEVDLGREFGLPHGVDFDDQESEQSLVNAAKIEMARSRQQLLATMVLMGINRIIVTNGRINAKVVFDIEASDQAKQTATASLHDEKSSQQISAAHSILPWGGAAGTARSSSHRTMVKSSAVDESESNIEAKAQLTGEVRVNFRSDTVPLERMVDNLDLQLLQTKAQPPRRMRGAEGAPPAGGTT